MCELTRMTGFMKTSKDPRHTERIRVMQEIFAWDFSAENPLVSKQSAKIKKNLKKIDKFIGEAAPQWPIERINKIDLAVLRLAVYELLVEAKAPPKVIVDEAVEIAKDYGSEASASFINGVLGKLITENNISTT